MAPKRGSNFVIQINYSNFSPDYAVDYPILVSGDQLRRIQLEDEQSRREAGQTTRPGLTPAPGVRNSQGQEPQANLFPTALQSHMDHTDYSKELWKKRLRWGLSRQAISSVQHSPTTLSWSLRMGIDNKDGDDDQYVGVGRQKVPCLIDIGANSSHMYANGFTVFPSSPTTQHEEIMQVEASAPNIQAVEETWHGTEIIRYTDGSIFQMKLFTFPQFYFETRGQRHRTTVLKTDCVSLGLVEKANPEGVNRDLVAGISGILGLGLELPDSTVSRDQRRLRNGRSIIQHLYLKEVIEHPSFLLALKDTPSGPRLILDPNLDLYGEFTRPVPLAQDWSKTGLWEIEIQSLFLRTRSGLTKLSSEPVALLDCGSTYTHLPETSFNQICGVLTTFEHDSDLYFPGSYSDDPPVLVIVTKNGVRLETAICPQIEKASMEIMTLKKDNARYVVSYVQETIGQKIELGSTFFFDNAVYFNMPEDNNDPYVRFLPFDKFKD